MRTTIPTCILVCLCLGLLASGCRRKAETASSPEVESAATKFTAAAESTHAPATAPGAPATPAPAQEMKQAVQAYKGGQFEDAVTRLQKLRATTTMTAQQRMALNDAMAAVMADIYALAAKGDQRAIQAVKQYEKMQTQGR